MNVNISKRSLILYASLTGNTEKVALRFRQVLEKMGWECDMVKIDMKTDLKTPSFDCSRYEFMCLGSYVHQNAPSAFLLNSMLANPASAHYDPHFASRIQNPMPKISDEQIREMNKRDFDPHRGKANLVTFDHKDKKGIVFVTFGGEHQGRKEALPSLATLESEMEHMHFQCIGSFACPGRFGGAKAWFQDLPQRPHERDLMKAQIFLEEILEELQWSSQIPDKQ
jgi:flavodoxin